ncbi:HK97-gp10 family putative phage morphogenesis protein [Emticicia fontis]
MSGFGFNIGVDGGDSLDALAVQLRNIPNHLTPEIHLKALTKAAQPLKVRMDLLAPEDTGLMAEDLRIARTKFKKFGSHEVIVGYRKLRGRHGYIAHFPEYGTENQPAKPFMRPADEQTKGEQERIYLDELQKEVDKRLNGL